MTRVVWLAGAVVLAGCQTKNEAKKSDKVEPGPAGGPSATAPKPKAPGGNATVDLTLTGAIEKKLSGPIGFCAIPMIGGKASGATFQVSDGTVQLAILATTEEELAAPKVVINTSEGSYVLGKPATTAKLVAGNSAEIEADLELQGKPATVHVKGTVTCD